MNSPRYRRVMLAAPLLILSTLASACSGAGNGGARPAQATSSSTSSATASATAGPSVAAPGARARADRALAALERKFHAQLGVYAIDTGTGRAMTYNADKRFAFCSTYKALATGLLLQRDTSAQLSQVLHYSKSDLVEWSPITSQHVSTGMTLRAVMAAALDYSDNTAANLLLTQLGGPGKFTEGLRHLGDITTDSNRTEPTLNEATPGDTRDTTTARAIATDLRDFVLGNALPESRRKLLTGWMLANTTGGPYIRAGVPRNWKVADKTGNGGWGTRNDIAVAWPPGKAPVVIAVLSRRGSANAMSQDALIADATKVTLAALRS
ncbi:MAG: class A beta-lactamase [Nocardiopsaceae bacterium]|nr:class A beta-lactamase [Nocardiopsaceae bacterium]